MYAGKVDKVSVMDLCVSTFISCVRGEVHLRNVMTSCLVHRTCTLPVVYLMGICSFTSMTVSGDADGHFLQHLLCTLLHQPVSS